MEPLPEIVKNHELENYFIEVIMNDFSEKIEGPPLTQQVRRI